MADEHAHLLRRHNFALTLQNFQLNLQAQTVHAQCTVLLEGTPLPFGGEGDLRERGRWAHRTIGVCFVAVVAGRGSCHGGETQKRGGRGATHYTMQLLW